MKMFMKRAVLGLLICLLMVGTSGCFLFGDDDSKRGGLEMEDIRYLIPDGVKVNWKGGEKIGENEYKLKVGEQAYPQFPEPYSSKMANNRMMYYRESSFKLSGGSGIVNQPLPDWGKMIGLSPGTVTMTCTYYYLRDAVDGGGSIPVSVDVVFHVVDKDGNPAPVKKSNKVRAMKTTKKTPTPSRITTASTQASISQITTAATTIATTTTVATTTTTTTTAFVPVTKITGVPAQIIEGQTITLNGTVNPQNATKKQIVWSVVRGENYKVSLNGKQLTAIEASALGTHPVIRATIVDGLGKGKNFVQDFEIEVNYSN